MGNLILNFALSYNLIFSNSWFKKRIFAHDYFGKWIEYEQNNFF